MVRTSAPSTLIKIICRNVEILKKKKRKEKKRKKKHFQRKNNLWMKVENLLEYFLFDMKSSILINYVTNMCWHCTCIMVVGSLVDMTITCWAHKLGFWTMMLLYWRCNIKTILWRIDWWTQIFYFLFFGLKMN